MELLESCELGLGSMGGIPQQSPGAACNETLMTAALLDVQALQLKYELRPRPEPAPVKEALSALNSTFTSPAALAAGQGQQHPVSSSSESVSTSVSIGSTSSGGETSEDSSTCRTARVKRLLASLTPAEVNTFRALSLAQVAGEQDTWCGSGRRLLFTVCILHPRAHRTAVLRGQKQHTCVAVAFKGTTASSRTANILAPAQHLYKCCTACRECLPVS